MEETREQATRLRDVPPRGVLAKLGKALGKGDQKAIDIRRSVPIMVYVGANGEGKSFCMMRDTLQDLDNGLPILSTMRILDSETGQDHPQFSLFEYWEQLEDFREGVVLLDEVSGVADSRDRGMPKRIRQLIPKLRKRRVVLRVTAPDWSNCDLRLRQITQGVTFCRGSMPDRHVAVEAGIHLPLAAWAPNRFFQFRTYDAKNRTEFTPTEWAKAKPSTRERFWAVGSRAFASYDTFDEVAVITNDCPVCGLDRAEKKCFGHDGPKLRPVRMAG